MRRVAILIAVLALGCTSDSQAGQGPDAASVDAPSSAPDGAQVGLRLVTVNLRCLLDQWPLRIGLLVDEVVAAAPDVIALQEVCRESSGVDGLQQLLARLSGRTGATYHVHRADTHTSWDQFTEGIALVSLRPLSDMHTVDLPMGVFPRRAVVARLQVDGSDLWLAGTHLSFGAEQADVRKSQLGALRTHLDQRRATAAALIAGDFNETPEGDAVSAARAEGWIDAWQRVRPNEPGLTFPSSLPNVRIDYVLLAPGSTLLPTTASIFLDTEEGGVRPSDHLGVNVELGTTP